MMTLDEAIEHAEWCAENLCGECADDHKQLTAWLKELRDIRSKNKMMKRFIQSYVDELGRETCHNVIGEGDFVCSECGAFVHARNANVGKSHVDEDGVRWYGTSHEHNFNYCPNCGARIEVE